MAKDKSKKKRRKSFPIGQLIIIIGLILCAIPVASHIYYIQEQEERISEMEAEVSTYDPERKAYLLEQAKLYNDRMGGLDQHNDKDVLSYQEQLSYDGSATFAWIHVPKAGVKMVVSKTVQAPALTMGTGHQPETSLPIGGECAHSMIAGHSGMQEYRVFDGIRALEEGDVWCIWVLGDPYAYRVTSWEIVDDEGYELFPITEGDQCTLVTCTTIPDRFNPKGAIGVNDKRLLVHGTRCEYDPAEFGDIPLDQSVMINDNTRPLIIAIIMLLLFFLLLTLLSIRKRRKRKRANMLKEYNEKMKQQQIQNHFVPQQYYPIYVPYSGYGIPPGRPPNIR